VATSTL